MIERWQKTTVTGYSREAKKDFRETVLHMRGADALGMAMRRNPDLPGCDKFWIRTEEAFQILREEDDGARKRCDIIKEESDWEYDF